MRTEQRTRNEYYSVYVANDGTEFRTKEECEKYEQSAFAVLNANYKKHVVGTNTEEAFFGFGGCDNIVDFVEVLCKGDADDIMKMNYLINPHMAKEPDVYKNSIKRMQNLLERAMNEDDLLLVGRGYNETECFWFIGTRNSMKEEIDSICKTSLNVKNESDEK